MSELHENAIEWYSEGENCTVSLTAKKFINRVRRLYESRPDDFEKFVENKDGSICATFPKKWLRIVAPSEMSEERKAALIEALRKYREESN